MSVISNIRDAGVVGAGGAGFPTHVKLNTKAEYILLNGAECEPLLRVDQQLMKAHPDEVLDGLCLAKNEIGAKYAFIGVKCSHPDVIEVLRSRISALGLSYGVEVKELPDVYPAGDEQVLVYELTGRVVPETAIPGAVGCVVINAETAFNIHNACLGQPVTDKFVTVTGAVPNPITVKVPVGTPVKTLFALAGLDSYELCDYEIINGGPMMGPLLDTENKPKDAFVTKTTKGLIVLPSEHGLILKKKRSLQTSLHIDRSACEQCSMCTDFCPRHLLGHSTAPHKAVRSFAFGLAADESQTAALTCCQCNLCDYFSCPAGISPRSANLFYMTELRKEGIKHTPKAEFKPSELRSYRQIPTKRLIARLGLNKYNVAAPLCENALASMPEYAAMHLKDHVGAPATPCVSVGDRVQRGQIIADMKQGELGAPVCAGISGTVERIENNLIYIRGE